MWICQSFSLPCNLAWPTDALSEHANLAVFVRFLSFQLLNFLTNTPILKFSFLSIDFKLFFFDDFSLKRSKEKDGLLHCKATPARATRSQRLKPWMYMDARTYVRMYVRRDIWASCVSIQNQLHSFIPFFLKYGAPLARAFGPRGAPLI